LRNDKNHFQRKRLTTTTRSTKAVKNKKTENNNLLCLSAGQRSCFNEGSESRQETEDDAAGVAPSFAFLEECFHFLFFRLRFLGTAMKTVDVNACDALDHVIEHFAKIYLPRETKY
jgi:hypothetical protein